MIDGAGRHSGLHKRQRGLQDQQKEYSLVVHRLPAFPIIVACSSEHRRLTTSPPLDSDSHMLGTHHTIAFRFDKCEGDGTMDDLLHKALLMVMALILPRWRVLLVRIILLPSIERVSRRICAAEV